MSTVTPTTTNPPVPKSNKQQTAWIGWLNEDSEKDSRTTTIALDFKSKRQVKGKEHLIFDDTNTLRAEKIERDINAEEQRFNLVKSLLKPPVPSEINTAITNARKLLKDLSVPKNNEAALKAVSDLSRKINEACKSIKPGLGSLLKEIVSLESSAAYTVALQCDTTLSGKLTTLKNSAKDPKTEMSQLAKSIQELKATCQDLTIGQKATKEKIALTAQKQKDLETKIGKLNAEVFNACQQFVNRATQSIKAADALEVTAVTKTAIDEYKRQVDALLNGAEKEQQLAEQFLDKYSKADPTKQKTLAELSQIQNKIESLKEGAQDAGYRGDIEKILKLDALATTFTPANLDEARKVLKEIEDAIAIKRQQWEDAKASCYSLIRFSDQALASSALSDDEYVMGIDSRSETTKTLETLAQAARDEYDTAVELAKGFKYGAAVLKITELKKPTGALGLLEAKQKEASELLGKTKTDTEDLEARKKAFNTSMGDVTNKSHIRFSSDAMALMMQSGIGMDSDGDVVYSDQFRLMQKQLEVGLKMWHGLVDAGCDPFKAAERAFEGIPENYWPPQAVRVIAMFRKAEAEFAGEREAAELTEGLQASTLKKVVDVSLEVKQHAGERAADAFSGMLTWFKETHKSELKGLGEEEVKKRAAEFFKENNKIDFKAATDAVGGLAAGLGALNGAYKVGQDAKDIHEARQKIEAYNPETDSPVSLKIAEFERNRAVWHLISDMADTIISALGPATDAVPALGLLGDCKTVVISVGEAAVYFTRLREVHAIGKVAKTDPESLAELALANEAHKLGLIGAQKTFDAAIAVMKIIGQGLDMGGVTAAAGFGVKAGATVLMYCGKAIFALINWRDRKKAVKALSDARADPTNIEVVEIVFERCTMYSRFLLADGALNGDAWCRQYILSRGVSDRDLDNPNTSTAVIREYLNVTFQPVSGDAEEDDDLGTSKNEQKQKNLQPSEEQEFISWSKSSITLTAADFNSTYDGACQSGGLKNDKKQKSLLSGLLGEYETAFAQADKDMAASKVAFGKFQSDPKNEDNADAAEELLNTAIDSGASLANVVRRAKTEFMTCAPTTSTKDTKGKFKIHASFQIYLRELADAMELAYTPFDDFRNESSKQSMALKLRMDVGSDDLAESVRKEFAKLGDEQKKNLEKHTDRVKQEIDTAWTNLKLKTKSAGKGIKAKLIDTVVKKTGLKKDEIEKAIDKRFNEIKVPVVQSACGMCFKIAGDELVQLAEANKIKNDKDRKKQISKVEITTQKKIDSEVIEFAKDKAAALLASEFDDAVNYLFEAKPGIGKFEPPTPIKLTRDYWIKCKELLDKVGWKFAKTGIGPQLDEFEEAETNWKLLPKDDQLQAAYNGAFGKLLKCAHNIPILRTDGIAVPGLKQFKADYITALKNAKSEFDRVISDPNEVDPKAVSGEGWAVPDSKLTTWPITCDGWKLIHDLVEKHTGKKYASRKALLKYFRRLDDALDDFANATEPKDKTKAKESAREYAAELSTALTDWSNKLAKPNDPSAHPSIVACVAKIKSRIQSEVLDGKLK